MAVQFLTSWIWFGDRYTVGFMLVPYSIKAYDMVDYPQQRTN